MDDILKYINNNEWEKAIDKLKSENMLNKSITGAGNILHFACIRGNEDIIFKLVKDKDIDILKRNKSYENCLMLLLKNGWNDIAKKLYNKYPELLNTFDDDRHTPLNYARQDIFEDMVDTIIKNKMTYIFDYRNNKHRSILNHLIDENMDVSIIKKICKHANINKFTYMPFLHCAVAYQKPEIVKVLLECGAEVDLLSKMIRLPYHQ